MDTLLFFDFCRPLNGEEEREEEQEEFFSSNCKRERNRSSGNHHEHRKGKITQQSVAQHTAVPQDTPNRFSARQRESDANTFAVNDRTITLRRNLFKDICLALMISDE